MKEKESVSKQYHHDMHYSPKKAKHVNSNQTNTKNMILAEDLIGTFGIHIDLGNLVRGGLISSDQYKALRNQQNRILGGRQATGKDMPKVYKKFLKEYGESNPHLYTKEERKAFELMDMTAGMLAIGSQRDKKLAKDPVSRLIHHLNKHGYTYTGAKKRILHTALHLREVNLRREQALRKALKYDAINRPIPNGLPEHAAGIKSYNSTEAKLNKADHKEAEDAKSKRLRDKLSQLRNGDRFLAHCFNYFDVDPATYYDTYPPYPKEDKKYAAEAAKSSNPFLYSTLGRLSLNLQRRGGDTPSESVRKLKHSIVNHNNLKPDYKTVLNEFAANRDQDTQLEHQREQRLRADEAARRRRIRNSGIERMRQKQNRAKRKSYRRHKKWSNNGKKYQNHSYRHGYGHSNGYNRNRKQNFHRQNNDEDEGPDI